MLQTSANPTRRINASSGFYYAVLPSFASWPFILVRYPYLLSVWANTRVCVCVCGPSMRPVCIYVGKCMLACVRSYKFIPRSGLNHLSSGVLSRAMSGLSYQSIDGGHLLRRLSYEPECRRRPGPHRRGILMWMQIDFGLPTSADIDPPADFHGGDRWTVTSEWEEIGTHPPAYPSAGGGGGFIYCLRHVRFIHTHPSSSSLLSAHLQLESHCVRHFTGTKPLSLLEMFPNTKSHLGIIFHWT